MARPVFRRNIKLIPMEILEQPTELEELASSKIVDWISSHIAHIVQTNPNYYNHNHRHPEEFTSQNIEKIRQYFDHVPGIIMNSLLEKLKKKLSDIMSEDSFGCLRKTQKHHKPYVTGRMIEVLFTQNVSKLTLNDLEFGCCKISFTSKAYLLKGLAVLRLSFDSPIHPSDYYEGFNVFLNKIPNMKHLILTGYISDFLRCVVKNCKSIEKLDLHIFFYMRVNEIALLCQLPNLKTVDLYEDDIDYFYNTTKIEKNKSSILEYISSRKQFQLKSYIVYGDTEIEDLQMVIENHPEIERLSFVKRGFRNFHIKDSLKILSGIKDLSEMIIEGYEDFYEDSIKELIQIFGESFSCSEKVQKLELRNVCGIDLNAIVFIGMTCPYLQILKISNLHGLTFKSLTFDIKSPIFKQLRKFHLSLRYDVSLDESNPSSRLVFILTNCPNIEDIEIYGIELPHDFLLQVLDKNPMKRLKTFRISPNPFDRTEQ